MSPAARRAARLALGVLAVGLLASLLSGCGGGGAYRVRAIFDDAANLTTGEQVKVAGVVVGQIQALDVTPDQKAAVTLAITDPGFQDFRRDASCIIRPQSLIGEKYVECAPTQPRPAGTAVPPALPVIRSGSGAGERLLPVTQTSSPVDLDLVGDVLRLPYRQRLTIIINELGAGLAGNAQSLEAVVRRANPALAALDGVLAILARENTTLQSLATESDQAIAPLAHDSAQLADWVTQTNKVATVTAANRAALEASLRRLPEFLTQLTPTLQSLGHLADESNPVLANLAAAAPQVNQATTHLTGLANAGKPFIKSLGRAAVQGTPAVKAATPVVADLSSLGAQVQPFAANTSTLLSSLQSRGGLQDILDFIFRGALAGNGYNSLGHYLRSYLTLNLSCITYSAVASPQCSANFPASSGGSSATKAKATTNASAATTNASAAGADSSMLSYLLGH